jgi:SNF2 family DNA or RNA helicase
MEVAPPKGAATGEHMEIVQNKAVLVNTRHPHKITEVIEKATIVQQTELPNGQVGSTVAVPWNMRNTKILRNLGFKKTPAPITGKYKWPGIYTPMKHQVETAAFLTMHPRAFCLNDMGTGKTMSCAWAADYLLERGIINRVLIIAPLSILDTAWRADLFKSVMHRRVDIAHGTPEKRRAVLKAGAEFVIINYDGIEVVHKDLLEGGFDLIICDEASALKNSNIKRWKLINQLISPETWVWLLTGTPAAQSPDEAYGLAKMINPKSVPKYHGAFKDLVMYKVSTFRYVPRKEAKEIVHRTLQPAIRFTKEECMDLPEMTYVDREVPLTSQQARYYENLRQELLVEAAGQEISAINAAVEMNKLLQISSGAVYSDTGEIVAFDCKNRLNEMLEIVEQASHKTLIFANFKHSIDTIQEFLTKHKITNAAISGDVSLNKRSDIIQRFQTTPEPHVLVIQPQAASHGITLHAANTIIWWSPIPSLEYYLQANARVHRAGQKNPCTVIHLFGSTVERQMYTRLQGKKEDQASLLAMYKDVIGLT